MIQHGLVVGSDEAQIGTAVAHTFEAEVAGVQADQQGGATNIAADRSALRSSVDGNGFAVSPVRLPPCLGQAR